MTSRTIRRAMERKAEKQARKQAVLSERQLQANAASAKLSTGPQTPEGKAISSRNALKTGLTGRTVLLPGDDATLYQQHVERFRQELRPVGDRELEIVQSIADSKWRLARIPSLEFGIYALGRLQFAEEFAHLEPSEAAALIEAKTFLTFQRQLNNLSIQESRLRRQCEKDAAELARLQTLRAEAERQTKRPANPLNLSQESGNGFVFEDALQPRPSDAATEPEHAPLTLPQAA